MYAIPASVQALIHDLVEARQELILKKCCTEVRNGTLSPEKAYAAIHAIAALRMLPADLDSKLESVN